VSKSVTLEPSPPRQTCQSRLADCASSPLGLPSSEGLETSRASREEQGTVSCASRTGSKNLCHPAGGSETRPYDPAPSSPTRPPQPRLGERAVCPSALADPPGLPGSPDPHPSPCAPRLRVSDDEAVEEALVESAMAGSIRAQIFWLINRAPYKWRPVGRMSFMPRMPSLASMLKVSEPRLREWAYRARSARRRTRALPFCHSERSNAERRIYPRATETLRSAQGDSSSFARRNVRAALVGRATRNRPRSPGPARPPLFPPEQVLQSKLVDRASCPSALADRAPPLAA